MTESAYFATASQGECYKGLDVENYEVVGTLDSHTCGFCGEMDGQVFPVNKMQAGSTAPPFHPWCRCTTAPWYEDMVGVGQRFARDKDGKTYTVPSDMTYDEWKEKFVEISFDDSKTQNFKAVVYDKNDKINTSYKKLPCIATKVVGYENNIYVSDRIKLKPKQLNYVNSRINKAVSLVGAKNSYSKPRVIICDPTELPSRTVAAYTASDNTLRLSSVLSSKKGVLNLPKDGACYDNHNSVYVHEFLHWADAQEYIEKHGTTDGYLDVNIITGKRNIDKVLKNGYNINSFSGYAKRMLELERYDEVWTEYRTETILRK